MRKIRISTFLAAIAVTTISLAGAAQAFQMTVLDASNPDQIGTDIDGTKKLTLKAGDFISLLGEDGEAVTLNGPYNEAPAAGKSASGGGTLASLGSVLRDRGSSSHKLGVVRGVKSDAKVPSPHLISTAKSGHRCVNAGQPVVLYRPSKTREAALKIKQQRGVLSGSKKWKAGRDQLSMGGASSHFKNNSKFDISVDGDPVTLTFHTVPADQDAYKSVPTRHATKGDLAQILKSDLSASERKKLNKAISAQAIWMAQNNCKDQAKAAMQAIAQASRR